MLHKLKKTLSVGHFFPFGTSITTAQHRKDSPEKIIDTINSNNDLLKSESVPNSPRLNYTDAIVMDDDDDIFTPERIEMRTLGQHQYNNGLQTFGHDFRVSLDLNSTFCDHCQRSLTGLVHARRCLYCNLTCHVYCCDLVQVHCLTFLYTEDESYTLDSITEPSYVQLLSSLSNSNCSSLTSSSILSAATSVYDLSSSDTESLHRYGIKLRIHHSTTSMPVMDSIVNGGGDHKNQIKSIHNSDLPSSIPICAIPSLSSIVTVDGLQFLDGSSWELKEIWRRVDIFASNNQGLTIALDQAYHPITEQPDLPSSTGDNNIILKCTGTIRVHIILIRPVLLTPSGRPSSVFDFVSDQNSGIVDQSGNNTCGATDLIKPLDTGPVWLPRGLSKLLCIDLFMTVRDVILALLRKFQIKDNPKKFALYEHVIEGEKEVSVRKMADNECPLLLMLIWTDSGTDKFNEILMLRRIVLQENDTSDIDWYAFSLPELNNFLTIIKREEEEYRRQIILKYDLMKKEIYRLLDKIEIASGTKEEFAIPL